MERVRVKIEKQALGRENSPSAIFPLIQFEARKLRREIEERFIETGKLGLPTTF
jgi:hypothetical protein